MASKDMYPELISRRARQPVAKAAFILIAALLAPVEAFADWTGGINGGAVVRNGETSNRVRVFGANPDRPLTHLIFLDWIINDGDDSFELGYRPRYYFTDAFYGLVELSARTDDPIGIDRETTETIGVGYEFLQTESQRAYVEVSGGARQLTFTESYIKPFHVCCNAGVSGNQSKH